MMTKRTIHVALAVFVLFSCFTSSLSSQTTLKPTDLFIDPWTGIPTVSFKEPFPWGIEPVPSAKEGLAGHVAEYTYSWSHYRYPFGEKTSNDPITTVYKIGQTDGDFIADDEAESWSEDGARLVWREYSENLIKWRGAWSSPTVIEEFRKGHGDVYATWTKEEGSKDRWKYISPEEERIVVRTVSGSSTKWVSYDSNGDPAELLAVTKDTKGTVTRCEYWSNTDTKDWEIKLVKSETGATITILEGNGDSASVSFTKTLSPKSISTKTDSGTTLVEFSTDSSGRVTDKKIMNDGIATEKATFKYDLTGNILEYRVFKPVTLFGETQFLEDRTSRQVFTYLQKGAALTKAERPARLDAWLAAPEISTDSAAAEEQPAVLTETQKLVGTWKGMIGIFDLEIIMNEDMTCTWDGGLGLSGTYEVDEDARQIVYHAGVEGINALGFPINQSRLLVSYTLVDDDTLELVEGGTSFTVARVLP